MSDGAFGSFSLKLPPTRFPVHRTEKTFFSRLKCSFRVRSVQPPEKDRTQTWRLGWHQSNCFKARKIQITWDATWLTKGCFPKDATCIHISLSVGMQLPGKSLLENLESQAVVSWKYSWTPTTPLNYHFWVDLKLGVCSWSLPLQNAAWEAARQPRHILQTQKHHLMETWSVENIFEYTSRISNLHLGSIRFLNFQ